MEFKYYFGLKAQFDMIM